MWNKLQGLKLRKDQAEIRAHQKYVLNGNVEKSRQRRSRPFAVLTYCQYAPRVKRAAALLDKLFWSFPQADTLRPFIALYWPLEWNIQQPHLFIAGLGNERESIFRFFCAKLPSFNFCVKSHQHVFKWIFEKSLLPQRTPGTTWTQEKMCIFLDKGRPGSGRTSH